MGNRPKDLHPNATPHDATRRGFLSALVFAAGAIAEGVAGNLVAPNIGRLLGLRDFSPHRNTAPAVAGERLDLLFKLFLSSGIPETHFIAPDSWSGGKPDVQIGGTRTYGHESEILQSISDLFYGGHLATWEAADSLMAPSAAASRVMIGSGASNPATNLVIGMPSLPRFSVDGVTLPYGIREVAGELRRLQYGKVIKRKLHAVCDDRLRTLWQPEGRAGWQTDDYLLITRVPAGERGAVATVFAGLHGPGTRAAELLWSLPLDTLRELDSRVSFSRSVPYYQAVFRASGFAAQGETRSHRAERRGVLSHVPTVVDLVLEKCPPVPLYDV